MGGNLFEGNVYRHSKPEYILKLNKISKVLTSFNVSFDEIKYISDKKVFGDLDILVKVSTFSYSVIENLCQNYSYRINGKNVSLENFNKDINYIDVFSINFDGLQVDLIPIFDEYYEFAKFYHAYNDLGGLIAACIKKMGFSLSKNGLYVENNPYDGKSKIHKIYLTHDPKVFCDLFQLDYSIYDGSATIYNLHGIFHYLSKWKYFDTKAINPNTMNATRKNRARKRSTYNELKYICQQNNFHRVYNIDDYQRELENKIISKLDSAYITKQYAESYRRFEENRKFVYAMSSQRVLDILGYVPENISYIFKSISQEFGGNKYAKETCVMLSDNEYKLLIEKYR